jgi:hypothetical protein
MKRIDDSRRSGPPHDPSCRCGRTYPKPRTFSWGSKLFGNRIEFQVFVCDSCRSYWYSPTIPKRAKQYAFETFDRLHRKNRLPSPATIREYRRTRPDAYRDLDLEAYERGELRDYHSLFYCFFAEHITADIDRRDHQIEEVEHEISELAFTIREAELHLARLREKQGRASSTLRSLYLEFVMEPIASEAE